jgi:hypothetical protein
MSVPCTDMRAELGDLQRSALGHRQPPPDVLRDRSQAEGYGVVLDTVSVSRRGITVSPCGHAERCPKSGGVIHGRGDYSSAPPLGPNYQVPTVAGQPGLLPWPKTLHACNSVIAFWAARAVGIAGADLA